MKNSVTVVLVLCALCFPAVAGSATAGETIGIVRTVSGVATVDRGGKSLQAVPGLKVMVGDTLVTGRNGTLGAILTGVFATRLVNDALKDSSSKALPLGLVDGNGGQILNQAAGIGIAILLAVVGTLVILKVCDLLLGLRVDPDHETEGLDLSMHGEEGYNFES